MKRRQIKFNKVIYSLLLCFLSATLVLIGTSLTNNTSYAATWQSAENDFSFEQTGDGSQENPYLIDLPEQLATISKNFQSYYNKNIKLIADIDLSKYEWLPMGSESIMFLGNFDGNEHTIYGLRISSLSNLKYAGLFGYVNTGTIKNLTVASTTENPSYVFANATLSYAGAVAGYVRMGQITNVINSGVEVGAISQVGAAYAGGLVGLYGTSGDQFNFYKVSNFGKVTAYSASDYARAGGIVGGGGYYSDFSGNISYGAFNVSVAKNVGNVYAYSSSSSKSYVGGIVGFSYNTGSVSVSYNKGYIEGGSSSTKTITIDSKSYSVSANEYSYVGGIIGYTSSSTFKISDCYNTSSIAGYAKTTSTSGVYSPTKTTLLNWQVDGAWYGVYAWKHFAVVYNYDASGKNKESTTTITYSTAAFAGGIAGYSTGTITNVYSSGTIVGGDTRYKVTRAQTLSRNFTNVYGANDFDYLVNYYTIEWRTHIYASSINGNRGGSVSKAYSNSNNLDYTVSVQLNQYDSKNSGSPTTYTGTKVTFTVNDGQTVGVTGLKTSYYFYEDIRVDVRRNSGSTIQFSLYYAPIEAADNNHPTSLFAYGGNQKNNFTIKNPVELTDENLDSGNWKKNTFINNGMPILNEFYW